MSLNLEFPKHSQENIAWQAMHRYAGKKAIEKAQIIPSTPSKELQVIEKEEQENTQVMKNDKEIASAAKKALRRNIDICINDIKVKVKAGWITLYGEQNWNYQRESARNCIHIKGVKGIINNISVKSNKNMILAFMWENLAIQ
ncbi:MAG: ornithine aminotransferase [Bacteroidota bacterium]|nr:ornithine aminotransferase [Bacteroidota bacterium]